MTEAGCIPKSASNPFNVVSTQSPPVITSQPANLTVTVSNTAMFTVTATGTAPLSYQWSFNHTNLLGATNATLLLPNVQFTQTGSYSADGEQFCRHHQQPCRPPDGGEPDAALTA